VLPKPSLERRAVEDADAARALAGQRRVIFAEGALETPVYNRERLEPGATLSGPALIVQSDCTTLIHPCQRATVDPFGNLIVATGAGGNR
jgi:N-methylhydantoinase A